MLQNKYEVSITFSCFKFIVKNLKIFIVYRKAFSGELLKYHCQQLRGIT